MYLPRGRVAYRYAASRQPCVHPRGGRSRLLELRDKSFRPGRQTREPRLVEMEELEVRELGVGGRAPVGIGNRQRIVAYVGWIVHK